MLSKRNFGEVLSWRRESLPKKGKENRLLPFSSEDHSNQFIYQHDNARIHVNRDAMAWFGDENIDFLEWSACSPDMNPI